MEVFGILFAVPVAFVANAVYGFLVATFVRRRETARRVLWWLSAAVLAAFAVEGLLLVTIGAVRARTALGPAFYAAHVAIFFLGPPALANVLILRRKPRVAGRWYVAAPICTAFAFVLILMQYGVSEALYGVDGDNGPFSRAAPASHQSSFPVL